MTERRQVGVPKTGSFSLDPKFTIAPVNRRTFGSFVEHMGRCVYTGIYVNHPHGTQLSQLRRANGGEKPYGITMFCLGNEMDGIWQTGHKTAHEYGRLAVETARGLRAAEPWLELVACGSSTSMMETFGSWESEVLELTYDAVDYISAHAYYEVLDGDVGSFLASAVNMDHFVASVVATADSVGARLKSDKKIQISFDEWNVWYQRDFEANPKTEWDVAPRVIEDHYNVADAVVVGSLLISLLRHSDRVTAACQAQLVNVIAPILTEPGGPAWRQTIFHPFAITSRLARGTVLRLEINSPTYETTRFATVPVLDAVATHDLENGDVTVFVVNRDQTSNVELSVDVLGFGSEFVIKESWSISDADLSARNTAEQPDRVVPRPAQSVRIAGGVLLAVLPAVSWTAIRLGIA